MESTEQVTGSNDKRTQPDDSSLNGPQTFKPPNSYTKSNRSKKTKGRVKIKMEFIENKIRRYTTFSKRKTGIMKKAYELSTLTGTQVMLLVASETGHVYTFATEKLQPMITSETGKSLIQSCLTPCNDDENSASLSDNKICIENFTNEADFGDDDDEDDEYFENEIDEANDSLEEQAKAQQSPFIDVNDFRGKEKNKRKLNKNSEKSDTNKSNKKQKINTIFNETTKFSIPPSINQIISTHQQLQQMQHQPLATSPVHLIDNGSLSRGIHFSSSTIK
ncbi:serum response factor -like protein [Brachionus plicatilis]|uniref:Serum response factor-like protein n=1 Tax=Brachionus plicatilis TaxID=10195 RepID=A0A3M7PKC2_BRAPC|nr:serum response factor -like protein [Brachionus plicatilis]